MKEPIAQGPVDVNVRPVIAAYKDFCGVSDGRFDEAIDTEMIGGAAYPGYDNYRAGWDAALSAVSAEVDRLTWALDGAGNRYRRPAMIDCMVAEIEVLRA
jgi:hypothetical protein